MRDISERLAAEMRLQHMAHYDSLTGLPNRTLLYATLDKTLAQASADGGLTAVLLVDLDHFKNVNDTLGHVLGDELLSQLSSRLVQCVTHPGYGRTPGRGRIRVDPHDAGQPTRRRRRRQQDPGCIASAFRPQRLCGNGDGDGQHRHRDPPDRRADAAALIKYADTAMYRAKLAGRDTFRFFHARK